jgi:hypothetical protein
MRALPRTVRVRHLAETVALKSAPLECAILIEEPDASGPGTNATVPSAHTAPSISALHAALPDPPSPCERSTVSTIWSPGTGVLVKRIDSIADISTGAAGPSSVPSPGASAIPTSCAKASTRSARLSVAGLFPSPARSGSFAVTFLRPIARSPGAFPRSLSTRMYGKPGASVPSAFSGLVILSPRRSRAAPPTVAAGCRSRSAAPKAADCCRHWRALLQALATCVTSGGSSGDRWRRRL